MTVQLLWDEAVGRLRTRVSPQNYDMWLRPIELMSCDGATLRLRAPNSYVRLWFESNFLSSLLREIQDLGHELVAYKRRIGPWLLWRAGPASGGDARYWAALATDTAHAFTLRLFPDGRAQGSGPSGAVHDRFRAWKEDLRDHDR